LAGLITDGGGPAGRKLGHSPKVEQAKAANFNQGRLSFSKLKEQGGTKNRSDRSMGNNQRNRESGMVSLGEGTREKKNGPGGVC